MEPFSWATNHALWGKGSANPDPCWSTIRSYHLVWHRWEMPDARCHFAVILFMPARQKLEYHWEPSPFAFVQPRRLLSPTTILFLTYPYFVLSFWFSHHVTWSSQPHKSTNLPKGFAHPHLRAFPDLAALSICARFCLPRSIFYCYNPPAPIF